MVLSFTDVSEAAITSLLTITCITSSSNIFPFTSSLLEPQCFIYGSQSIFNKQTYYYCALFLYFIAFIFILMLTLSVIFAFILCFLRPFQFFTWNLSLCLLTNWLMLHFHVAPIVQTIYTLYTSFVRFLTIYLSSFLQHMLFSSTSLPHCVKCLPIAPTN